MTVLIKSGRRSRWVIGPKPTKKEDKNAKESPYEARRKQVLTSPLRESRADVLVERGFCVMRDQATNELKYYTPEGVAISVKHLMTGTDHWGVPVGFDAGAADDDCAAVTNVGVGRGSTPGVLLPLPIRERSSIIMLLITAKRLFVVVEPEPAGASSCEIQSGKHSLVKTLATLTAFLHPNASHTRLDNVP